MVAHPQRHRNGKGKRRERRPGFLSVYRFARESGLSTSLFERNRVPPDLEPERGCGLLDLVLAHGHDVAEGATAVGHACGGVDVDPRSKEALVDTGERPKLVVALHE